MAKKAVKKPAKKPVTKKKVLTKKVMKKTKGAWASREEICNLEVRSGAPKIGALTGMSCSSAGCSGTK